MEKINLNVDLLLRKDEVGFIRNNEFRGKKAGLAWKYNNHLNGLARTRFIIFVMVILILYPAIVNYLYPSAINSLHDIPDPKIMLYERGVYSIIFLLSGLIFNRFRIVAILLASVPLILAIITYVLLSDGFGFTNMLYLIAVLLIINVGFYNNYMIHKLREQLEHDFIEQHLVE